MRSDATVARKKSRTLGCPTIPSNASAIRRPPGRSRSASAPSLGLAAERDTSSCSKKPTGKDDGSLIHGKRSDTAWNTALAVTDLRLSDTTRRMRSGCASAMRWKASFTRMWNSNPAPSSLSVAPRWVARRSPSVAVPPVDSRMVRSGANPLAGEGARPLDERLVEAAAGTLIGPGGIGEAVAQHHAAARKGGLYHLLHQLGAGRLVQQKLRFRRHLVVVGAQQHLAHLLAYARAPRLARAEHLAPMAPQRIGQKADVGGLAGALAALEGYEHAGGVRRIFRKAHDVPSPLTPRI